MGTDAETFFAVAPGVPSDWYRCTPSGIPFHVTKVTTDGLLMGVGGSFAHAEPLGGPYDVPRGDHAYPYKVNGTGRPLDFKFADSISTDNYGAFKADVLTQAECEAQGCVAASTAPVAEQPAAAPPGPSSTPARSAVGVLQVTSTKRRCASRRVIRIHLRAPKGVKLRSAVVRYAKTLA